MSAFQKRRQKQNAIADHKKRIQALDAMLQVCKVNAKREYYRMCITLHEQAIHKLEAEK